MYTIQLWKIKRPRTGRTTRVSKPPGLSATTTYRSYASPRLTKQMPQICYEPYRLKNVNAGRQDVCQPRITRDSNLPVPSAATTHRSYPSPRPPEELSRLRYKPYQLNAVNIGHQNACQPTSYLVSYIPNTSVDLVAALAANYDHSSMRLNRLNAELLLSSKLVAK
jgi:hypothetical protein